MAISGGGGGKIAYEKRGKIRARGEKNFWHTPRGDSRDCAESRSLCRRSPEVLSTDTVLTVRRSGWGTFFLGRFSTLPLLSGLRWARCATLRRGRRW